MNLLFTCAGRRNYLLKYFKEIKDTKIFACDVSIYAPALYAADEYFIVPEVYDNNYITILLQEAKKRHIDAVFPLNDLELPVLATNKSKFAAEGITVIVPDKEVVDLCFDKLQIKSFAENLTVKSIPTFLIIEDALNYQTLNPGCRFVIKPRWGSASFGIEYPENNEELISLYPMAKKKLEKSFLNFINSGDLEHSILIQRKLSGQEYGLDVVNNLNAEYVATFIRRKIAMRSGETDKAETVYDDRLFKIGEEIGKKLKHIGILDCDLFLENDNIYLLEMNPRFGGGYPFIQFAGANLPLALVEWLKGNKTPPGCFDYKDACISAKVDEIVSMNNISSGI